MRRHGQERSKSIFVSSSELARTSGEGPRLEKKLRRPSRELCRLESVEVRLRGPLEELSQSTLEEASDSNRALPFSDDHLAMSPAPDIVMACCFQAMELGA